MPKVFRMEELNMKPRLSPVPEFAWHTTRGLSELAGAKQLLFEIRSLDPGKYSYPYHFHRSAEEMFVILSGQAMLRTPLGLQEVKSGDTIFFECGADGAHQLYNHTSEPCCYVDLRTTFGIDVAEYPDSGKINILPYEELYQAKDRADYYLGEDRTAEIWRQLMEDANG